MENFQPVIDELEARAKTTDNPKLQKWLNNSIAVLAELDKRDISPAEFDEPLKTLRRQLDGDTRYEQIRSFYAMLTDTARKKFNLTVPKFYQNQWMVTGWLIFGMPFGFIFSAALGNFAFIGIGIPIGLALGIGIGTEKDKKAKAEGRQLDIIIK